MENLKKYCDFEIIDPHNIKILKVYKDTYVDARYKYQINEPVGPHDSILLERIHKNNHNYGKFKCSYCEKEFISRIDVVAKGSVFSCGCQLK